MSEATVNVYLIIIIASGVVGMIIGVAMRFTESSARDEGWNAFPRGLLTAVVGSVFLTLLQLEKIGAWTAFLSVGAIIILQEYLFFFLRRRVERTSNKSGS